MSLRSIFIMKQLVLTVLFLCVHSAAGLQCLSCYGPSCSSQSPVNCSRGETLCFTRITEDSYTHRNFTQSHTWIDKGCASAQTCSSTRSHYVSHNIGSESHLSNTTCCDTDDCNMDNATLSPPAGSLQCYGCSPWTYECSANVTCNALETCFKAVTDDHYPLHYYGCVSENQCSDANLSSRYFDHNTSVSCCNSSHCNAPEQRGRCLTCSDDTCSSQHSVTCSMPMCYTSTHSGSDNRSHTYKGCAGSGHLCPAAGSLFVSYHLGNDRFNLNITCCDSDDCNTAEPAIAPPAGTLQCYSCDHYQNYCKHVTCNALEICSNTTFSDNSPFYGCVSKNLCYNASLSQHLFGYYQEISCCDTAHCNVPPTAAPPITHNPPIVSTLEKDPCDKDDDGSVFSAAGRVLPLRLPLSLLGLFSAFLYSL